jgi:hypothetical protein
LAIVYTTSRPHNPQSRIPLPDIDLFIDLFLDLFKDYNPNSAPKTMKVALSDRPSEG